MPVTSWRRSTCADSGSHCGSAGGWPLPHHDDLGMPRRCCINEARFLGRADRRDVLVLHVRVNSGVPARRTRFPISGATDAASLARRIQINLDRCVFPDGRLVNAVDEHHACACSRGINAPRLAAWSSPSPRSASGRYENDLRFGHWRSASRVDRSRFRRGPQRPAALCGLFLWCRSLSFHKRLGGDVRAARWLVASIRRERTLASRRLRCPRFAERCAGRTVRLRVRRSSLVSRCLRH
jgi:hypothetical protein